MSMKEDLPRDLAQPKSPSPKESSAVGVCEYSPRVTGRMTVTVGITAHNEEENIVSVLLSLLNQTGEDFSIERVLLICDGCSDRTFQRAVELTSQMPHLEVIDKPDRKGKVARMNELFAANKSDLLITLDADIALGNAHFVEEMVKAIKENGSAVLVTAHQVPLMPDTFTGKVIHTIYQYYDLARLSVPGYNHIQNLYGAGMAFRQSFAEKLCIPMSVLEDRGYLYLSAKQSNGFCYAAKAVLYYRPAGTVREFHRLMSRTTKMHSQLELYAGKSLRDLYVIPLRYKLRALAKMIMRNPFRMSLGVLVILYTKFFARTDLPVDTNGWEILPSTKKVIQRADLPQSTTE